MAIEKWIGFQFSTGSYPGADYLDFQKEAIRELKKMVKPDFTVKANKNHYAFSAVLHHEESGKYVYISISDVRDFGDQWYNRVLIRMMAHDKDWTGGPNHYCTWPKIKDTALWLLQNGG